MSYFIWKTLHLFGLVSLVSSFLFLSFGITLGEKNNYRKWGFIFHGVGFLLILSTAFGLVGELNLYGNFPLWANIKFYGLLALGGLPYLMKRFPKNMKAQVLFAFIVILVAIFLAVFKPFV